MQDYEIRNFVRMAGFDPGEGIWVARDVDSDRPTVHAFASKLDALEHAVEVMNITRGRKVLQVLKVPYGEDLLNYQPPER